MKVNINEIQLTKEVRKTIKENIKRLRIAAGFKTQIELAEAMGLTIQGLSDRINKTDFKSMEISRLLFLLNTEYEEVFPAPENRIELMSEVEQIIATAKKQVERGELTPHELEDLFKRYHVAIVVEGDRKVS